MIDIADLRGLVGLCGAVWSVVNINKSKYNLHVRAEIHLHSGVVRPFGLDSETVLLHLLCPSPADLNGSTVFTQYDIKNHKIFLKKIKYPEVKLDDLFIGNVFMCYNRQLKIVAFGD